MPDATSTVIIPGCTTERNLATGHGLNQQSIQKQHNIVTSVCASVTFNDCVSLLYHNKVRKVSTPINCTRPTATSHCLDTGCFA